MNVLGFLGDHSYQEGEFVRAQAVLGQSLALAQDLGAEALYCGTLVRLVQIALETGEAGRAAVLLDQSLRSSP